MCDQHSTVLVHIPGATSRGHLGQERAIDECIAPVVDALNRAGVPTLASCCGHGGIGSIILEDGRELVIAPDRNIAREALRRLTIETRRAAGHCDHLTTVRCRACQSPITITERGGA